MTGPQTPNPRSFSTFMNGGVLVLVHFLRPGSRSGRPDDLMCALHGTKVGCHDLPQSHSKGKPTTPDAFQIFSTHVLPPPITLLRSPTPQFEPFS